MKLSGPRDRESGSAPALDLARDGYVVLRGVLPREAVLRLGRVAHDDLRRLSEGMEDDEPSFGFNASLGSPSHGGFMCPLARPYLDASIVADPRLHALTEAHLGTDYYLLESVLNSAGPQGTSTQSFHGDADPPGSDGPSSAGVAWVIPLGDVGPDEGMTELVAGSHVAGSHDSGASEAAVQPHLSAGDVLVRDLALRHRGMPNRSSSWRLLFTLVVLPSELPFVDDAVRAPVDVEQWVRLPPVAQWLLRRHRVASGRTRADAWPTLAAIRPDDDGEADGGGPGAASPDGADEPAEVARRDSAGATVPARARSFEVPSAGPVLVLDERPPHSAIGFDRPFHLAAAELARRPVVFVHRAEGASTDPPLAGRPGFVELRLAADCGFWPVGADDLPRRLTAEGVLDLFRPRYCRAHRPVDDLLPLLDGARERGLPLVYDRPNDLVTGRSAPSAAANGASDAVYRARASAITVADRALAPLGRRNIHLIPDGWAGPARDDRPSAARADGVGSILCFDGSGAPGIDADLLAEVVGAQPRLRFTLVPGDLRGHLVGAWAGFLALDPVAVPHPAWSTVVLELVAAGVPVVTTAGGDLLDCPLVRGVDDARAASAVLEAFVDVPPLAAERAEAELVAATSTWDDRVAAFDRLVDALAR